MVQKRWKIDLWSFQQGDKSLIKIWQNKWSATEEVADSQ